MAEETIRAYFETRLALLEPIFPLACHRLCEGPDFSLEFNYKPPQHTEGEILALLFSISAVLFSELLCFLSQDLAPCFLSSMQTSLLRSQLDSAGPVVSMLSS